MLDAFVKTALKDDPALLANWNSIKRVNLVGRRGATTPDTPVATPVAPVTPTPAPTPATPAATATTQAA